MRAALLFLEMALRSEWGGLRDRPIRYARPAQGIKLGVPQEE